MARRKETGKRTRGGPAPPARPPRRRAHRGPLGRWAAAIAIGATVVVLLVGGGLLLAGLLAGGDDDGPATAVIVDQLSLTYPNPSFVETATDTLEQAGYDVAYIPGEDVGVKTYRDLPEHGYDLVIFRVHLGLTRSRGYVGLFTAEPYSDEKYNYPGLGRIFSVSGGPKYFGVGPEFIESAVRGSFDGAVVVMMGCNGLATSTTADAFIKRGAKAVVSWDKDVSPDHTDAATERLLEKLAVEGLSVEDAVRETAAEVGPDPTFGAELRVLAAED